MEFNGTLWQDVAHYGKILNFFEYYVLNCIMVLTTF